MTFPESVILESSAFGDSFVEMVSPVKNVLLVNDPRIQALNKVTLTHDKKLRETQI